MPTATIYAGNNFQSVCNRLNGSTLIGGSNTENHLPVGYSSSTDSRWRAIIKFPNISASIPGGARIVKAEVWVKTTGSNVHMAKGSNARMLISRINQGENPGFSGGSGEGWYTNANPAGFSLGSSTAITFPAEGNPGQGVVKKYDITDYVEDWLSSNYIRRDGGACRNYVNNGIEIKSSDENSATRSSEFWSTRGGYEPRLVVEYTTEADPVAPSITDPTAGDKATAPTSATVQWAAGTGDEGRLFIGTAEDDASVWDSGWNACTPGAAQVFDLSAASLPIGQTLYIEARSRNDLGVVAQSPSTQVYILPIPTVSIAHPPSGGRCHVHNLGELDVWTDAGLHAKPRVEVNYVHPTGVAAQSIEVSVDNGATWHTFDGVASGAKAICDVPQAVYRATDFVIKARATGGAGQVAPEVSRTARVNFGQVVLPFDPGPSNSDWVTAHAPLAGGARAQRALAYRVSGGSWVGSVSELPDDLATGEMLVRLSTSDAAQPPSQADLTLRYQSTPPPAPDFWTAVNCEMALDPQVRRFGVHSLKVVPSGSTGRVEQTDYTEVSPNTKYTLSVFINTLGASLGVTAQMFWVHPDGTRMWFNATDNGSDYATQDSTGEGPENWQRLRATFTTPGDVDRIKVGVYHGATTKQYRIDSFQLESGGVASSWRPGTLGPAVILDVGGVAIDGQAGGIFRARGSNGPVVTLGPDGLLLDGEPYITAAEVPAPSVSQPAPVRRVYEYTGSTATWTKPAGLSHIEVEVQGGGGRAGGGAATGTGEACGTAGAGGGGYARKVFSAAELPATCTLYAGFRGDGGSLQTDGTAGEASYFQGTGITEVRGNGGAGSAGAGSGAGHASTDGGVGGTASGGDINIQGGDGGLGGRTSFSGVSSARPITGNHGGGSHLGLGGMSPTNAAGGNASGYGGGGAGVIIQSSQSGRWGGAGSSGVVIVTEHYLPVLS